VISVPSDHYLKPKFTSILYLGLVELDAAGGIRDHGVDADGADCAVAEGGGVADVGDVDAHARAEVEAVGEI
jgi:hypothetical protein